MGVDPDTVDLDVQRPLPGIETSDYQTSRQFTYFARKVRSVRRMHDIKGTGVKAGDQQDWVADPKFTNITSILTKWLEGLPRDLQVNFPEDDTPPWLPSHFVGNMHSYYHLTIIMLHRPQLMHSKSYADGSWKHHMAICCNSSKAMCRLQEAVLQTFGLSGLLCMQRGINFVIYAVLTCTMIHLVSIASISFSRLGILTVVRFPSRLQIQLSTPKLWTTSPATCGSWSDALKHGRCPKCSPRLMRLEKHSPRTQANRSN